MVQPLLTFSSHLWTLKQTLDELLLCFSLLQWSFQSNDEGCLMLSLLPIWYLLFQTSVNRSIQKIRDLFKKGWWWLLLIGLTWSTFYEIRNLLAEFFLKRWHFSELRIDFKDWYILQVSMVILVLLMVRNHLNWPFQDYSLNFIGALIQFLSSFMILLSFNPSFICSFVLINTLWNYSKTFNFKQLIEDYLHFKH